MKRHQLLDASPAYEEGKFSDWMEMHHKYRETDPGDPLLDSNVSSRIGFPAAASKMRTVMLVDTATRLPEVLMSLRNELVQFQDELNIIQEKKKFRDPIHLKDMKWRIPGLHLLHLFNHQNWSNQQMIIHLYN